MMGVGGSTGSGVATTIVFGHYPALAEAGRMTPGILSGPIRPGLRVGATFARPFHRREAAVAGDQTSVPKTTDDWYWAARRDGPAGDGFVIENGQEALWRRVRAEIDRNEQCLWMPIHRTNMGAQLEDILDMMITVVPTARVNLNRFVFEAAKIPVFAKFLRDARSGLCNYVSNSCFPDHQSKPEPYSDESMRRLGKIVNRTLGRDDDWF